MSKNFIFIIFILLGSAIFVEAQTLPIKIKNYLDKTYAGWKLTSIADGCYSEFANSVIMGDFDGDKKRDYTVKFVKGNKGYILAFLERKTNYITHMLESMSATEIKNTGLSIAKRGDEYPIGGEYPDYKLGRLKNDAPLIGTCESHAYHYVYRNGKFN